jgi:hypothetical protein
LTEREVAFFTRIEALIEQTSLEPGEYPDRYVRSGVDRVVARMMLSRLMVGRGSEPPDLPRLVVEAKLELADRIGGEKVLEETMNREGIDDRELTVFLRDQVRATYYIDRAITPIVAVSEESLREAYRSTLHPFRGSRFDDARARLRRWLVTERLRTAELEFLQGARARIKVTTVMGGVTAGPTASGASGK